MIPLSATGSTSFRKSASLWPTICRYCSNGIPEYCILVLKSFAVFSTCSASIGAGISILDSSISLSTISPLAVSSASSFFLSSILFLMLALYSLRVSNSETSAANSSSSSGSSLTLISFSLHLNTAALPARSGAWYSAGKVTLTSNSSPGLWPATCSSNPGMNVFEPSVKLYPSSFPPANAVPSTNPS